MILFSPLIILAVIGIGVIFALDLVWFLVRGWVYGWSVDIRRRMMSPEKHRAWIIQNENEALEMASRARILGKGSHPNDHPIHKAQWQMALAAEKLVLRRRELRNQEEQEPGGEG